MFGFFEKYISERNKRVQVETEVLDLKEKLNKAETKISTLSLSQDEIEIQKQTIKRLEKERKSLTEEVERLKLKKKMEDEDIKHMIKINKERNELEMDKRIMEITSNADNRVGQIKDEYRDKMEIDLRKQNEKMADMYSQILERLPNVSASFERKE
jgi:myosin heavy subunit